MRLAGAATDHAKEVFRVALARIPGVRAAAQ